MIRKGKQFVDTCWVQVYATVSPLEAAGIWEIFLGPPPYLCPKGQWDQSMVGKQEAAN